jgi:hypothetical protein
MERSDLKIKFGSAVGSEGKAKTNITTARIDPSIALLNDSIYLHLGLEPTWRKETRSTDLYPADRTVQYTTVAVNPQIAYRLHPNFGIGLGYQLYRESIVPPDAEPSSSITYGRFHMSAQYASGPWRFDLGGKIQAIKEATVTATNPTGGTNSITEFRYLATEFSSKASFDIIENLWAGLFLRYFAYDKKNNVVNPYRSVEIHTLDRVSFGAQSIYHLSSMARFDLTLMRKSALDLEQKTNAYVSANALEIGVAIQPYDATECGIRAGYAFGKDERKTEPETSSSTSSTLTVESTGYSLGIWLAHVF